MKNQTKTKVSQIKINLVCMATADWLVVFILAALLCIVLAAKLLLCCFTPAIVLPRLDIPTITLVSLSALLIDHFIASETGRTKDRRIALLSAPLCFFLLPWAAGETVSGLGGLGEAVRLGVFGGATFDVLTLAFDSLLTRPSFGPTQKTAPVVNAFCLWCAAQIFTGILL